MRPDLSVFEREVYRRADLGEGIHVLAAEFGLPHYVIGIAAARGNASLAAIPHADKAYEVRLLSLARRRPGLFQIGEIPWDAEIEYADKQFDGGPDTDDIADPFGLLSPPDGQYLGGIS